MSDLIDRQALLKQIDIDSDGEPGYYGDTWKFIDTIKNMPNVHDLPKDTDTISRQAAIEALRYAQHRFTVADEAGGMGTVKWSEDVIYFAAAKRVLDELPSAQSETAKRIVGKSRNGMTLWYQCDMCNEPVDVQDNFCRGCGRRLIDE